jgi:hypothetical protein
LLERRSECGLLYYTRHFRLREGVEIPHNPFLLGGPRGEIGYLAFAVVVEDNRTFALVLSIPPWDRELRALKSERAYMTAALFLPLVVPWVHPDQSEPITRVLPMGRLQNLHRSLIIDGEPVAVGIQPAGDALCHTNPTFAYGAVLSIQHGFTLADIAGRTEDPHTRALAFDYAVGADAAARFDTVSAEDRDRLRLWRREPIDVRDPADSIALFLRMTAYLAAPRMPICSEPSLAASIGSTHPTRSNTMPPSSPAHSKSPVTPDGHRQAGLRVRNCSRRSLEALDGLRRDQPRRRVLPRPHFHRGPRAKSNAGLAREPV